MLHLLLLACAEKVSVTDTSDPDTEADTAAPDTDSGGETADTSRDTDSATDTDTGTTPDTGACASSCDCPGTDELCYAGTCRVAGAALDAYRDTLVRVRDAMDPATGGFASEAAYPTEALMTLASGAALLCDTSLADAARTRAEYARSWETSDHFLVWSGFGSITRDYQARHIYNLWAAGHALEDQDLLDAADDAATAMLGLERVRYKDEWTLFCTTYSTQAGHACDNGSTWIDVNQNSEIGLAFALLANDPESALYGNATALDVVRNELGAALSMQDASTGAIPIGSEGGYETKYDTLYGSYAAWSWAVAAPIMTDPSLAEALDLAGGWLGPLSDGSPQSQRYYPSYYEGDISLAEGSMRLPVLAATGRLDAAFTEYFWGVTVPVNTETNTVWLPLWLSLQAGIPLSALIPPAE